MLRIEEIVGAMDDEFRYALAELADDRLAVLLKDKTALRRLRPVGVSHAEAVAMIHAVLAARARRAAAEARRQRRALQAGECRACRTRLAGFGPPPDPPPPRRRRPDRPPAPRPGPAADAAKSPSPAPAPPHAPPRFGLGSIFLGLAASVLASLLDD